MSLAKEFKEFAMKGNVVDMAVGIIIGGAFGKIITSLVNDVIMPPIGMLLGGADFKGLMIPLKQTAPGVVDVAIKYGVFINTVLDFTIVALAIFLLVKGMNSLRKQAPAPVAAPTTKQCPECQMDIPLAAKRCGHCTSVVH
jgi:large conductance mechanosensitive channel